MDERFPWKAWVVGALTCCGLAREALGADDSGTNQMSAIFPTPTLELEEPARSSDWQTRFGLELLKNQNLLLDRLGPTSGYELTRRTQSLRYGIHDAVAAGAETAFERALQNSLQETALAMVPVGEWTEMVPVERWQGVAERFLEGSFGNTAEQEVGDLPSAYSATESWWRSARRDGTLRYGFRPRTAPYFYATSDLGHFEDRPLLSLEARARYLPFNRFQTSFAATAPLPHSFELSLSALCEPTQLSRTTAAAARLQRVFGTGLSACALFVGVSHTASETAVFCGFSRPW
jgi:hypothetical protein